MEAWWAFNWEFVERFLSLHRVLSKPPSLSLSLLTGIGMCTEMYGALEAVAKGPAEALAADNSSMVGVGMCPEGIETNPMIYDFMAEWAFRCAFYAIT
jgi:hypothetical protein